MFDFRDESEEIKRAEWYQPLGEFMLLFSNLEFTCNEWISLLCESKAVTDHIRSIWSFKKRVDVLLELIEEHEICTSKKELWSSLWRAAGSMASIRNVIAHNPPFENFYLEYSSENTAKVIGRLAEIHQLSKPLGELGSGITLEKLRACNSKIRGVLVQLEIEGIAEAGRQHHANS